MNLRMDGIGCLRAAIGTNGRGRRQYVSGDMNSMAMTNMPRCVLSPSLRAQGVWQPRSSNVALDGWMVAPNVTLTSPFPVT
jgi:hypothetical protein